MGFIIFPLYIYISIYIYIYTYIHFPPPSHPIFCTALPQHFPYWIFARFVAIGGCLGCRLCARRNCRSGAGPVGSAQRNGVGWDFLGGAYQNGCLKNHESLDISGFDSVFGRVLGSPNHWFWDAMVLGVNFFLCENGCVLFFVPGLKAEV